jgi:flagellar hook-associated protein FlgK
MASFFGIEIARKSLMAHQTAMEVTGHNISNAGREGYSRQVVVMEPTNPMYPPGFYNSAAVQKIGSGVFVSQINRVRNEFIDRRLIFEEHNLGYWGKMDEMLHQIELIYNEPSDSSLRTVLDSFWNAWDDLAKATSQGELAATREIVIQRSIDLTQTVNSIYSEFQNIAGAGGYAGGSNAIDSEIRSIVDLINGNSQKIAELNQQISTAYASGNPANDLLDKRDEMVKEISKYMDVRVNSTDPNEFRLVAGGLLLVQGVHSNSFEIRRDEITNKNQIFQSGTDIYMNVTSGEIKALMEVRDEILPQHMSNLNEFAIMLTDVINEQHRYGFGLDGSTGNNFFEPLATANNGLQKITGSRYINHPDIPANGNPVSNEYENFEGLMKRTTDGRVSPTPPEWNFIDVETNFNKSQFENDIDLNTSVTIETNNGIWTSPLLSQYTSIKEFMDDVADNLEGVEIVYDRNSDTFSIIGYSEINYINLSESNADGLWSAIGMDISTGVTKITDSQKVESGRIAINGYFIDYDADKDSLNDIAEKINNTECGVRAEINQQGRFVLRATAENDYRIKSLTDSGTLLTTLGILAPGRGYSESDGNEYNIITSDFQRPPLIDAGFRFKVNEKIINNTNLVAAMGGTDTDMDGILDVQNGPADGSNALSIAQLKSKSIMKNGTTTFNDFFNGLISQLGVKAQVAQTNYDNSKKIKENLTSMEQAISGVSLDEEMANMIKFQKGYTATSKYVSTLQQMMDSLIGMIR